MHDYIITLLCSAIVIIQIYLRYKGRVETGFYGYESRLLFSPAVFNMLMVLILNVYVNLVETRPEIVLICIFAMTYTWANWSYEFVIKKAASFEFFERMREIHERLREN